MDFFFEKRFGIFVCKSHGVVINEITRSLVNHLGKYHAEIGISERAEVKEKMLAIRSSISIENIKDISENGNTAFDPIPFLNIDEGGICAVSDCGFKRKGTSKALSDMFKRHWCDIHEDVRHGVDTKSLFKKCRLQTISESTKNKLFLMVLEKKEPVLSSNEQFGVGDGQIIKNAEESLKALDADFFPDYVPDLQHTSQQQEWLKRSQILEYIKDMEFSLLKTAIEVSANSLLKQNIYSRRFQLKIIQLKRHA